MDINEKTQHLADYGQILTGEESDLDRARLARTQYLKGKLRRMLDWGGIGDTKDIVTDLLKTVVLGFAIQSGEVTDPEILSRFKRSLSAQLSLYGGPETIMATIEAGDERLREWMGKYYQAKIDIAAAEDVQAVANVDIEDMPDDGISH